MECEYLSECEVAKYDSEKCKTEKDKCPVYKNLKLLEIWQKQDNQMKESHDISKKVE